MARSYRCLIFKTYFFYWRLLPNTAVFGCQRWFSAGKTRYENNCLKFGAFVQSSVLSGERMRIVQLWKESSRRWGLWIKQFDRHTTSGWFKAESEFHLPRSWGIQTFPLILQFLHLEKDLYMYAVVQSEFS